MVEDNNILIKNVRIIDAYTDKISNVYIENGLIVSQEDSKSKKCQVIDGTGKVLMPAFIDLHAHFREPGFTNKETIETGSRAAVKGGYTTVVLMANTNPVCSTMDVVNFVKQRAKEVGLIDVEQVVSITSELNGESIDHLKDIDSTVKFFSDDGKGVMNSKIMKDVLTLSKENNFVVISHAEDHSFSKTDMRLAENYMTNRDLYACETTGGNLHMAHVSTKEALKMIIEAKKKGVNVTCEVTPHHIFADNKLTYRVNPPFRTQEDIDFIIKSIKNGYVDIIATDHAPHTEEDKKNGSPGISGIETSFQLCLTKLVKEEKLSLNKLSELMSKRPAEIIQIEKGLIKEGYHGDVILLDINKKTKINVNQFKSKGKNSPFNDSEVFGEILMTIKSGKIVYNKADD